MSRGTWRQEIRLVWGVAIGVSAGIYAESASLGFLVALVAIIVLFRMH